MRKTFISALIAGALFFCAGDSSAQGRGVTATITPLLERDTAAGGQTVRAALEVALPEGFHVQSDQPRDPTLIPTVLTIDPPAGVTVTEIVFPTPVDLRQLGLDQPLAVFERVFPIGVQLKLARSVASGDIIVPAHLRYQACNDTTCFAPKTADAEWRLRVAPASAAGPRQHRDVFDRIAFGHGKPPGATSTTSPNAADLGNLINPGNATDARIRVATLDDFTVLATTGGYLRKSEFLKFIDNAEHGVKEPGLFEGRGPLAILLIVFLGGLALNLTPCVLPMIPINLAIIGAGSSAGSRGRGFLLGGAYGAAMALVYGILGVVVILTAGTFGTINSSAWFNLAIAVLFVVLGLAMFDQITIDFSRFSTRMNIGPASRGSFLLAFGMGAVAALLAGACVHDRCAGAALFSRLRDGGSLADCGGGPRRVTQARGLDDPRQAVVGRVDSGDRRVLRLRSLHSVREPVGGSIRRHVERSGKTQRRLVRVDGRRPRHREAAKKACPR